MKLLIKGGKVYSSKNPKGIDHDVLIEEGKISQISSSIPEKEAKIINAKGLFVFPGLVDLHCHLRDPGDPCEENIFTGTRAAAKGGFTSVACMPNTNPPLDTPQMIEYVKTKGLREGFVNVFPIGAITKLQKGEELTEFGGMVAAGAVAFSDDGKPVINSSIMRYALEYAKQFGVPIISHSEDLFLSAEGEATEGILSSMMGLKGTPKAAEAIMVARDVLLAKEFGKVHIAHVSCRESLDIIRRAKEEGVQVTCETCPHYFSLSWKALEGYNTMAKVNPPLRTEEDVEAIVEGIKEGIVDAIATDHAPHCFEKKHIEFGLAANGISGFETAFSLTYTELVLKRKIPLHKVFPLLTINPSNILSIGKGDLKAGSDADIVIFDPKDEFVVDVEKFESKGKNSPFQGQKLSGSIKYTIVGGKPVVEKGEIIKP
jgi:dihydroorotase